MDNKVDTINTLVEDNIVNAADVDVKVTASDPISLLREELTKEHSPMVPAVPIIDYLISKCECDKEFSERITLEKKSLKECLEYVLQEVKKKLKNGNGYIPDPEVYAMAETYYILDEVAIEKPVKAYEKAKERIKEIPKPNKQTESKITILFKEETKQEKQQISLFDF